MKVWKAVAVLRVVSLLGVFGIGVAWSGVWRGFSGTIYTGLVMMSISVLGTVVIQAMLPDNR